MANKKNNFSLQVFSLNISNVWVSVKFVHQLQVLSRTVYLSMVHFKCMDNPSFMKNIKGYECCPPLVGH